MKYLLITGSQQQSKHLALLMGLTNYNVISDPRHLKGLNTFGINKEDMCALFFGTWESRPDSFEILTSVINRQIPHLFVSDRRNNL